MAKKLPETVPNYNEERDMEKMAEIAAYFRDGRNTRFLGCQTDMNRDRYMITAVDELETLHGAVIDSFEVAMQLINMTRHEGQHPHTGAVDVVLFILCRNTTAAGTDTVAKEVRETVDRKSGIPIFLHEDSAATSRRVDLAKIRKGQFEGMAEKLQDKELWTPDSGPNHIRPTASVVAVGARMSLTTHNMNLDTDNMEIVDHIAGVVKNIRGDYHFVKTIGVELENHYSGKNTVMQVSISLVNYEKTVICHAFETVKMEARRYGINVLESKIVDAVPMQSPIDCVEYYLQACMLGPIKSDVGKQVMENWPFEDEEEKT